MSKVSCIIAAYNEAPRIAAVLQAITGHPLVDEVIVVDDCSTDTTNQVVLGYPHIVLVTHSTNQGKSQAVVTGIQKSTGDILLLLDADLVDLTAENITALVQPVIMGKADVSISLRKNSPWIDRLLGLDYISGERVIPKTMVADQLDNIRALPGFGLEVFFNRIWIQNHYRIKIVSWPQVMSTPKSTKSGLLAGTWGNIRMIQQILKVISVFEVFSQFKNMLALRVR